MYLSLQLLRTQNGIFHKGIVCRHFKKMGGRAAKKMGYEFVRKIQWRHDKNSL